MENPFKKLRKPPVEAPKELKDKVMADVTAFKFFSEVVGLFSSNYAAAAESFFKKQRNKAEK